MYFCFMSAKLRKISHKPHRLTGINAKLDQDFAKGALRICERCQHNILEQEGGVLIAGDTWGYFIGIGDVVGECYFEAVVVETVCIRIGHLREFQVVGGNDASHGQ